MNSDGSLTKKESRKLAKLNVFLRDTCGVPMRDSFRIAMVIVQNLDGILSILTDKEDKQDD